MTNQTMIKSTDMPNQIRTPLPPGSTSPMNAGIKLQQQQTASQMALIGKSGGSKRSRYRSRRFKGGATGAPVVQVPPVQSGAPNPEATEGSYKALTLLAQNQANQSVYDTSKTPADTANAAAQQQALYKSGGSKNNKNNKNNKNSKRGKRGKRGGSVKWGCFSGGNKSKKSHKRRKTNRKTNSHRR